MRSTNDITGARLVSKANDKKYEDGYDLIFGKKPSCLDSAYERKAMQDGMNFSPVFKENQPEDVQLEKLKSKIKEEKDNA